VVLCVNHCFEDIKVSNQIAGLSSSQVCLTIGLFRQKSALYFIVSRHFYLLHRSFHNLKNSLKPTGVEYTQSIIDVEFFSLCFI